MKNPIEPTGGFQLAPDREWYRIEHYDLLDPFLVNLVTGGDQWIFVSTSGALTAGRRSAKHALFPYETDDRLHRSGGRTGPITLLRVGESGDDVLWQPFAPDAPFGETTRSVSKSPVGDRLRFEEYHPELGLTFRYTWAAAPEFGLVRVCELERDTGLSPIRVDVLDGLLDVLPSGVTLDAQQTRSTLVDAYRRSEFDPETGLASFTLETLLSDQPDPAESLRATTMWTGGLAKPTLALSDHQLRHFRSGGALEPEHLVTGRKGAFLLSASTMVASDAAERWMIVADVEQDHVAVSKLRQRLASSPPSVDELLASIDHAHDDLIHLIEGADALQETADRAATAHHVANVLFNSMRGGTFTDGHAIQLREFSDFVAQRNSEATTRLPALVSDLGEVVAVPTLRAACAGDPELSRLVNEYLPLVFSRRHGDPSRPWNSFSIEPMAADGSLAKGYEGNWRDIFQNWEALLHSFPDFLESAVAKFLNVSTLDGNNPYRITEDGIDWEVPEEDSWSNIGYWGDHQIVYLHRLLDAVRRFHPGLLESKLDRQEYTYADAPYLIRPYEDLVIDPKATIEFDDARYRRMLGRTKSIGVDGQLVPDANGSGIHHASLAEKLLVPALAKLSNLVAGGGIWLNTQRPEWNDANNALVGNGVSVVTALYLSSYLELVDELLEQASVGVVPIDERVVNWLQGLEAAFVTHADMHQTGEVDDRSRRNLLDALGQAYSDYRTAIYDDGPGAIVHVSIEDLRGFIAVARPHLDLVATSAVRADGLFESYVLLRLESDTARLEPLYEMLEGQVAGLGSPTVGTSESLTLLDALIRSDLYRPDQRAFILYPDRRPPSFEHKNVVPEDAVGPAMTALLESASGIIHRDADGIVRFDSGFSSARHLDAALDKLKATTGLSDVVTSGRKEILDAYETVFTHRSFTGRSQSMYKYEGLGSVYWHMVSKLLFAVQEQVLSAVESGEDPQRVRELADWYWRIRSGLGFMKSVTEQGAFPIDPHSHTPRDSGAQQPGMTGQVKEGVLLRWGELGVRVEEGRLRFRPVLLEKTEFFSTPQAWPVLGEGAVLDAGTFGFTYCGIPVVYHAEARSDNSAERGEAWTRVTWTDGRETTGGDELDRETSRGVFARLGEITRIDVGVPLASLLGS